MSRIITVLPEACTTAPVPVLEKADRLSVVEELLGVELLGEAGERAGAGLQEGPRLGLPSAAWAAIPGPCARSRWW